LEETVEERQVKSGLRDNKTCKQLLGELFADKEFLEKLLQETGENISRTLTTVETQSCAVDFYNFDFDLYPYHSCFL